MLDNAWLECISIIYKTDHPNKLHLSAFGFGLPKPTIYGFNFGEIFLFVSGIEFLSSTWAHYPTDRAGF